MKRRFEYKFERISESWLGVREPAQREYRTVIERHAREGWRLVQIFAPAIVSHGRARFYEMIFERPASP